MNIFDDAKGFNDQWSVINNGVNIFKQANHVKTFEHVMDVRRIGSEFANS